MKEKILTLHPDGKKGVNIDKEKYDQIKAAILGVLEIQQPITYSEVDSILNVELKGKFEGSISWYVVTVKLDLEARGIIERVPKTSPHQIRMKQ